MYDQFSLLYLMMWFSNLGVGTKYIYNQSWNISYRFHFVATTNGRFQKLVTDIYKIPTHYSNLLGIYYISDDYRLSSGM